MSDWLVATMDEGLLAHGLPSKKEAVAFILEYVGCPILKSRRFDAGGYELVLGFPNEERATTFYVMRPDVARRHGFEEEEVPENCYYCGSPLDQPIKRRMERGLWYRLHGACATKWDNEKRRL